ncbi:galactose-binding domain-like protein [Hyaloraphidium curvatum]|nr:galactose-binding domain-like protein [Hyaloraphidium curvatum]
MHDHDHSEGARDHDHDGKEGPDRGIEDSLYSHVFLDRVRCLNESVPEAGRTVFKPWDERFDRTRFVESDADSQLLFHVPFTGLVKLKSICILGGPGESTPSRVSLFINNESLDFTSVEDTTPDQEFALLSSVPEGETPWYWTKVANFKSVRHLTIFIPENYGGEDEATRVSYIGLRGEFETYHRDPIITVYEAFANPADHRVRNKNALDSLIR